MRILNTKTMKKNGCEYCTEQIREKGTGEGRNYVKAYYVCPHDKCPYEVKGERK